MISDEIHELQEDVAVIRKEIAGLHEENEKLEKELGNLRNAVHSIITELLDTFGGLGTDWKKPI